MPKPEKWRDWGLRHDSKLGKTLNDLRKQDDTFCDVTICVGGRKFQAHKAVLCAASCYFETMFTSGEFQEGNDIEITSHADSLELMLDYIYTGDLNLFVENASPDLVCGFLDIACNMQVTNAIEECITNMHYNYHTSNGLPSEYSCSLNGDSSDSERSGDIDDIDNERPIPVGNAYQILVFAKKRDEFARLATLSRQYLQDNLEKLKGCSEILSNASVEFMEEFLSNEFIATAEEETKVLHFVINWLKTDWKSRQVHAYRLFQKTRPGLVSSAVLDEVFDEDVCAIQDCKNLVDKFKNIEDKARRDLHLFTSQRTEYKRYLEKWEDWDYTKKHQLGDKLDEMRKHNKLCDISIDVDGTKFGAHKAFLSASSCYFETMFTSSFKEGSAKKIEINGNTASFELLLQYVYTGELHISVENAKTDLVCGFLDMACYMQITDAIDECTNNMHRNYSTSNNPESKKQLDRPENDSTISAANPVLIDEKQDPVPVADAYYFLLFAKLRHDDLAHLARLSEQYLQENLEKLKSCDDILEDASVEFMEDFLSDEYLATAEEEKEVLHFVINWLKFDWKARKDHAYRLLQKIRLGLVKPSIRVELFDEDICAIPECRKLLAKVADIEDRPNHGWGERVEQLYPDLFATRSTVKVAISGHASFCFPYHPEHNKTNFKYFNTDTQEWKSIDGFEGVPQGVKNHALCYAASFDHLYLAGGCERHKSIIYHTRSIPDYHFVEEYCDDQGYSDDEEIEDDVNTPQCSFFSFDKRNNKWNKLPSMQLPRTHFCLIHLGQKLYAIDGVDSYRVDSCVSNIEYFNLGGSHRDRKWKYAAALHPEDQLYLDISAVAYDEIILAYGFVHKVKFELNVYYPRCNRRFPQCDKCRELTSQEKKKDGFQCNTWQKVLTEDYDKVSMLSKVPTLFVYEGICYRIMHHRCLEDFRKSRTTVNILDIEPTADNQKKVTIGRAVNQDYIPYNKVFAFRINDRVFAIEFKSVYDTGIRITEDQEEDVDLGKIVETAEEFRREEVCSSIVTFPFDKRFLL